MVDRERQPWERQAGENRKHHRWFVAYRDLGTDRTVRAVLRDAPKDRGGYGRAAWDALSVKAQEGIWSYRRKLAARYRWSERARAWDDYRAALAQKHADERAAEAAIREAEEAERERQRQIEAGRKAVAAGKKVVERLVALFEEGHLDNLTLERIKTVVVGEGGSRAESEKKALTEILPAALAALSEGQKIQRIAQEQATERREVRVDLSGFEGLADLIISHVPEDEWEAVRAGLSQILRGESAGDT